MLYGTIFYSKGWYYAGGVSRVCPFDNKTTDKIYDITYDANEDEGRINFVVGTPPCYKGLSFEDAKNKLQRHIQEIIQELQYNLNKNHCVAFPDTIYTQKTVEHLQMDALLAMGRRN